jgi:hypothetical protein
MTQLMMNMPAMTPFSSIVMGDVFECDVITRILINTAARIENKRDMETFLI